MAHRMDIELTSARGEEEFTWRAVGARQPRGIVPSSLLPAGSKVGDVFRVEAEIELDGISIVSVLPPKERTPEQNRIEYIGPERTGPPVTTVLAGRPRGRGSERGERRPRSDAGERPRRDGATGPRPARDRPPRSDRAEEAKPAGGEGRPARGEGRPARGEGRPGGEGREARGQGRPARGRDQRGVAREGGAQPAPRRPPPRFDPGRVHLEEFLASLTPEQRPIAERLAVGGLPAVRKALAEEQQRARSEHRPAASGEPIIAIAEQLLGDVKAAVWLDRAEAAVEKPDDISLRDLRMTVVGAAPRDEAGRELERRLRHALDNRVTKLREEWETQLVHALDEGRVLQALRRAAKPPDPSARFPATLVQRLVEQAGQAMTNDTTPDRWVALLDAVVQSPVRRQVKPAGMPKDPNGEVERQARAAASRVPAVARLLGMAIPPPPQPLPGERPPRPMRRRPGTGRPRPASPKPEGTTEPITDSTTPSPEEVDATGAPAEVAVSRDDEEPAAEAPTPQETAASSQPEANPDSDTASAPQQPDAAPERAVLPEQAEVPEAAGAESAPTPDLLERAETPESAERDSDDAVLGEEAHEPLDEGEAS